ncbi:MAG: SUMF1/EgtB/PvdO family nonheme iron enzyme [Chloroflexi bacterium]|nr:SUMF1/EgtB/PvdO family nonheme iron enzyme [Chloroflexota bacterium]
MSNQSPFVNLRNILADFYRHITTIQRVMVDANLDPSRIVLGANPLNNWHSILSEAERTNKVDALLAVVLEEYGENQQLHEAYAAYQASLQQGSDATRRRSPVASEPARQIDAVDQPFDIFLSYNRSDAEFMGQLQADLRAAGFTVWSPEAELVLGTPSWQHAVEAAIRSVHCLVAILSPEAKQSRWAEIEVIIAEELGLPIIPLLVRGDERNAVLFRLKSIPRLDMRTDYQVGLRDQLIPALQQALQPVAAPTIIPAEPIAPPVPVTKPAQRANRLRPILGVLGALLLVFVGLFWTWTNFPGLRAGVTLPRIALPGVATPVELALGLQTITPTVSATTLTTATPLATAPAVATATPLATATSSPAPTATPLPPTATPSATSVPTKPPTPTATLPPTATNTPLPTPTPPLPAGATRINRPDGAVYAWIPPGEFTMGSSITDTLADAAERPPHQVMLDGFWIMQTEVTNAQYKRCVEAGVCEQPGNSRWNDPQYASHPVVNINWGQAMTYAKWVGGRLPSEAEWEKASRGTSGALYPWGNQVPSPQLLNSAKSNKYDTVPVGSYPPGANQLYDMAGNVWEWTADWYDSHYYANAPTHNPTGPDSGTLRTVRGGSFRNLDYLLRSTVRRGFAADYRSSYGGFRVVMRGP